MKTIQSKKQRNFYGKVTKVDDSGITFVLSRYFARRSGPFSGELLYYLDGSDWNSLVNYKIPYGVSASTSEFFHLRQALAFFQKDADLDLGVDKEKVAFTTFMEAEETCLETNGFFRKMFDSNHREKWSDLRTILYIAQRKISNILGEAPKVQDLKLAFGPGANSTIKRRTSARYKLNAHPVHSKEAHNCLDGVWDAWPLYADLHEKMSRVGAGELAFVPKNAKTYRSIIIEPVLNSVVQKGIGSWIKDCLLQEGINLFDQSINKERAREGSINSRYCTIDLSSASDTIAYNLVLDLLPPSWFDLLSTWRTGTVYYKKNLTSSLLELEKFSSMGNGFTFELESLLFYAISYAVAIVESVSPDITVYGDDIVAPNCLFQPIKDVLERVGFSVNLEKSYYSGSFRESCGGDFLFGIDIRPFYKKDRWTSARLVGFHNHIVRKGYMTDELEKSILNFIPPRHVLWGCDGLGDGHLVMDNYHFNFYDDCGFLPKRLKKKGYSGRIVKTFSKVPYTNDTDVLPIGDALIPFYGLLDHVKLPKEDFCVSEIEFSKYLAALNDLSSRESDPYVLRGGERVRVVDIYLLNKVV